MRHEPAADAGKPCRFVTFPLTRELFSLGLRRRIRPSARRHSRVRCRTFRIGPANMSNPAHNDAESCLQRSLLNQLTIVSPCEVAWAGMTGSGRERHCASCAKSVHNLIEHTADEAYRLVAEADVQLCVRIHRDAAGNVITKDTLPATQPTRRGFLGRWAVFAASCLGLSSLLGCKRVVEILYPVQGDLCPPPNSGAIPNGTGKLSAVAGNLQRPPTPLPPLPDAIPASSPHTPSPSASGLNTIEAKSTPPK